jgi:1-acyl-sn-glycerol-3-phosphate acyltransferase
MHAGSSADHYNTWVTPARILTSLRRLVRFSRLALHLLWGMALAAWVFPLVSHARRDRFIGNWSAHMLGVLGLRIRVERPPQHTGGALLVCNHVSWLDIYLIHAAQRVHFVSKSEVRAWPVAGWLAHKTGTLFLERGRRADTLRVNAAMRELMQEGAWVAVFPEGTTGDGHSLRRFLPSLLQPAVELGCPVVPAALRYRTPAGDTSAAPAYFGEISLWQSLMQIVSEPAIVAELRFGESIAPNGHRRDLAAQAQATVASLLTGAPARGTPPDTHPTGGHGAAAAGNVPETPAGLPAAAPSASRPTGSPYPAQSDRGG